jgi:CubicO group peptidase (beta-lactamase class C family)
VPTLEPVHEAFQAYCDADPTYGAQLTVHVGSERVVDLTNGPGMQPDSLVPVYSSSKGATAVVVALLLERGQLDLDAVSRRTGPSSPRAVRAASRCVSCCRTRRACMASTVG